MSATSILVGLLTAGASAVATPAPGPALIAAAIGLRRDCDGADVEQVLSRSDLAELTLALTAARHSQALSADALWWLDAALLKGWRSQPAPPTLQQIYRDQCMADLDFTRFALPQLQAGQPQVHGTRAWLPLLDVTGDYFGLGLSLVLEDGQWRLLHHDGRPVPLRNSTQNALWKAWDAQVLPALPCDDLVLPPPPEPQDVDVASDYDALLGSRSTDEGNVWGYLQRQAAAYYAHAAATPSALSLWAQVRYSSLSFKNAPVHASPQWDRRISGALTDAQRAVAAGADADSLVLISTALARRLLFSSPLPQRAAARDALALALSVGDADARVLDALALAAAAGGHLADCTAALASLADVVANPGSDSGLRELAVVIALDCPIAQQRDSTLAQSVLRADPELFGPFSVTAPDARETVVAAAGCVARAQSHCPLPESARLSDLWDLQAAQARELTSMLLERPAEPDHAAGCRR